MTPANQSARTGSAGGRDLQVYPFVLIPKVLFTRFKPSLTEIGVYVALKFHASTKHGVCEYYPIRTMAQTVDLSESTFKRGIKALEKKGVVRVRHRSKKSTGGARIPLPNLYELVNLEITPDAI